MAKPTVRTARDGVRYILLEDIPGWKGHTDNYPACLICGRDTAPDDKNSLGVLLSSGDAIIHPDDREIDKANGTYMGFEPIGSSACAKKVPAEFIVRGDDPAIRGV